ncbi:TldD/PmbA family protein [Candidatus Microgenomates bacterium]|nr:TldD/PmbA family protein [Candidatus Microgenomates bacterium]
MVGESKLKVIANKVLRMCTASECEVLLFVTDHGLTRFANSQIHQNVAYEDLGISVRVILHDSTSEVSKSRRKFTSEVSKGARIGVASTNSFDPKLLRDVVKRAENLAKINKVDPHFKSLPKKSKYSKVEQSVYEASADARANAVAEIIRQAKSEKITASGAYDTVVTEVAVANSHGLWAYHSGSAADLSTILMGATSTGFAGQVGKRIEDIDVVAVGARAVAKVETGKNPITVKPGEWEVILEPQAVNEMMAFFAWLGPNARIYHEQASNFSGKLGQKVMGKNITIMDDPLNSQGFPMPFDFEGYPKSKLEIVGDGVFKNVVYDSYHAAKFKAKNTGHALPAPNIGGPMPLHLTFKIGKKSLEEMIKSVKKGLLVTRLWYVRVLNPRTLSITGMTRDGTFLIRNGKIVRGVKNMRFNQSIPDALSNVVQVGRDALPLSSMELEIGANIMPPLHIKRWNFTSGTEF